MRRWIHLALAAGGLALLIWGFAFNPVISCRGVTMHAGDVCVENDLSKLGSRQVQSYEQRRRATKQSQPVLIGLGAVILAFGIGLYVQDRHRPAAGHDDLASWRRRTP